MLPGRPCRSRPTRATPQSRRCVPTACPGQALEVRTVALAQIGCLRGHSGETKEDRAAGVSVRDHESIFKLPGRLRLRVGSVPVLCVLRPGPAAGWQAARRVQVAVGGRLVGRSVDWSVGRFNSVDSKYAGKCGYHDRISDGKVAKLPMPKCPFHSGHVRTFMYDTSNAMHRLARPYENTPVVFLVYHCTCRGSRTTTTTARNKNYGVIPPYKNNNKTTRPPSPCCEEIRFGSSCSAVQ